VNQVQVQRDVGMTFSAALRSMLRQAPNIIMVGEIRDKETAEISGECIPNRAHGFQYLAHQ
jgi:type II secretory ATPase GspE/PulE/Tfp pilus assembly ATPase PilB-like protein